jgi:uncharacterized protein YaaN involved in tellurite resistance
MDTLDPKPALSGPTPEPQSEPTSATDPLPDILRACQLPDEMAAEVRALASKLDLSQPAGVTELGRNSADRVSHYAEQMLEQVNNRELGEMGEKLGQIVLAAKSLNLGAFARGRTRPSLFGSLFDRVKLGREQLMQKFDSVDRQIHKLMREIDGLQYGLRQRIRDMERIFQATQQEFRSLGLAIAAGKLRQVGLQEEIATRRAEAESQEAIQQVADLQAVADRLDKRVADLQSLRMSALQTLPMVRMIQSNNQTLVEKFHDIKELTLPAWKRQFMLALALSEQRKAVQLAQDIDDATNAFLKQNAEMLQQASIATARANQRATIDITTLESVQQTLIGTVEEVVRIHQEGRQQRHDAEGRIGQLCQQLEQTLRG